MVFVLRSVPAAEEDLSVGHGVSAGSGPGGAGCRSDVRHSHRQRTRGRVLPRHHCERPSTRPSFSPSVQVPLNSSLPPRS